MSKAWLPINKQRGFSIVEILLAATLLGFLSMALIGALVYGKQSTVNSGDRTRAVLLAEEGVEATRNIRDAGFSSLADGTYGLTQSGGQWVLSGSSDITGIYTRQVAISTIDSSRKSVLATVSWLNGIVSRQSQVETRLTNWQASIVPPTSWLNAIFAGGVIIDHPQDGVKVATQGNYAYLVQKGTDSNFVVADISNPAAPVIVGYLVLSSDLTNVFVSGNYAYVTSTQDSHELMIVDISNPAAPVLAGTYDAPDHNDGLSVLVSGNTAYLTRGSNGDADEFTIIDVSTPALPVLVGGYNEKVNMNDVAISGNYAFVGTDSSSREILVINITNPANPAFAAAYNLTTAAQVRAIKIIGNTLLVGQDSYLSILDITNPLILNQTGVVTIPGPNVINDVDAESLGTYAFLGTTGSSREFQVVDISHASIVRTVDLQDRKTLNGIAYNPMLDIVVGASTSRTQELVTFKKN